jgi:hypothetical protein
VRHGPWTVVRASCAPQRLQRAEILVLVFSIWWFGLPALLKGWFDRVWAPGVAFDHLTERYVQTLQPPAEGRLEVGDDVVAGLWFRVTSKGMKSWSIRSRRDGQAVRFTLGSYTELGLATARQRALQQIGKIKDGYDPVTERRRKRYASIRAKTESLSALLDLYVDTILATRKSGKTRARDLRRDLKPLLGRPASLIQRSDLTALIDRDHPAYHR